MASPVALPWRLRHAAIGIIVICLQTGALGFHELGRALLVVDMQGCFLPGGALPTQISSTTHSLVQQINTLRTAGGFDTVVFTQDWHPANHVSFAAVHQKQPLEALELSYTSDGLLCNMQHRYPEASVPCSNSSSSSSSTGAAAGSSALLRERNSSSSRTLRAQQQAVNAAAEGAAGQQSLVAQPHNTLKQVLWPQHCLQHSKEAQLHPGLLLKPKDLVVRKGWQAHLDAYSAFNDNGDVQSTGLSQLLQQRNISSVVVVGVALDYCVLWSALDALKAGFETTLVLDATAPVSKAGAADAVQQLQQAGAQVVESIWDVVDVHAIERCARNGSIRFRSWKDSAM